MICRRIKVVTGDAEYVLPRIPSWKNGQAASILRAFCKEAGLTEITFHRMRACFAMMCLCSGESLPRLMAAGGWKRLRRVQHYINASGVSLDGVTSSFKLLPAAHGWTGLSVDT